MRAMIITAVEFRLSSSGVWHPVALWMVDGAQNENANFIFRTAATTNF